MTYEQLKEKARSLPYEPGVYVMRNKEDKVIYVGKAKKLKNRVSQYFQDTASHSPKTRIMVSKIDHFDVIVAATFNFETADLKNGGTLEVVGFPANFVNWQTATDGDLEWIRMEKVQTTSERDKLNAIVK